GLTQLHHALGQLAAQGVAVRLDRLFDGRAARRLNLGALEQETRTKPFSPTTWMVNGSGVRPASRPAEPWRRPTLALPAAAPAVAAAPGALAAPPANGKAHDMSHPVSPTLAPPITA